MSGYVGEAVASATADYGSLASDNWIVRVANPKAATSDISFRAYVRCIQVDFSAG